MIDERYKKICPEDVFVTALERQLTEAELWQGISATYMGNRPSGNNFIDLFAYLIRKYGRKDIKAYARIMGITCSSLTGAILAMSGMGASEWRNQYLLLEALDLLENSSMEISEISRHLGFSQPSVFSKFFRSLTKKQPYEWRNEKKKGIKQKYHHD